ncbi:PqqD family protein [Tropicimonas sp. IMCC6043]|uniref:PqqD family protein n=1 Tax=Tropicimonas sp. IMCC6043 TaxID=2510645 RepID=UPI00101B807C|nr:PqqD family protein [Tropicimonas sp. IMCC6043]RYH07502.1 PqqD family protein [Tropicimonas sp. IMCC6043]
MTEPEDHAVPARYVQTTRCVSTEVGAETVLLHLDEGMYFGLDAVGAVIWEAMAGEGATLDALTTEVCGTFEVEPMVAERDIRDFLDKLAAHKLLETS